MDAQKSIEDKFSKIHPCFPVNTRIAVVGAGPSGISAAYALCNLGYNNVTIIEKHHTVGGMCESVDVEGRIYDLGGQVLAANSAPTIFHLAKETGKDKAKDSGRIGIHAVSDLASDMTPAFLESRGFKSIPKSVAYGYTASGYGFVQDMPYASMSSLERLCLGKFDVSKMDTRAFGRKSGRTYRSPSNSISVANVEGSTVLHLAVDAVKRIGDMKEGFYDKIENQLHGQQNSYYVGELMAFELTERNSSYSMALISKHFATTDLQPGFPNIKRLFPLLSDCVDKNPKALKESEQVEFPELSGLDGYLKHWATHNITYKKTLYKWINEEVQVVNERTYEELNANASCIAHKMLSSQKPIMKQGDRVLLVYVPGLDFIDAFFGCLRAEVLSVPVLPSDPMQRGGQALLKIENIAKSCNAMAILSTSGYHAAVRAGSVKNLISLNRKNGRTSGRWPNLPWIHTYSWVKNAKERHSNSNDKFEPRPDNVCFLQFTSGSTGDAKGVIITHGGLIHNVKLMRRVYSSTSNTVLISWLPQYHNMGLIGGLFTALVSGGSAILFSPMTFIRNPLMWLETMSKFNETHSAGPNFAFELVIRRLEANKEKEWNKEELTEKTFRNKLGLRSEKVYTRTGDLGRIIDGNFFITGRIKDLIIVAGRNIYPSDIEKTVESSSEILRAGCCAVIGVPEETLSSKGVSVPDHSDQVGLVVIAEVRDGKSVSKDVADEIKVKVAEEHGVILASVKLIKPRTISKTTSGKIKRFECLKQFIDGTLDLVPNQISSKRKLLRSFTTGSCREGNTPRSHLNITSSPTRRLNKKEIVEFLKGLVSEQTGISIDKITTTESLVSYGIDWCSKGSSKAFRFSWSASWCN
ncbi:hypothetical protein K7X08_007775 [Anisodus acutangulus]|uniref:4-coumarate--CoA ligase n=1 Tax=Anisodus acutangulus TaxID=402998 RepID=A0A9Q1MP38_9SOLA|nr:hypothetical protein K7X08_007775 [Anisodus acutangulus]